MQNVNKKLPNISQTLTSREGEEVTYAAHVGPSRAQRRDARFRPAMIAAAIDKQLTRDAVTQKRAEVGVASRFVAALRMLGAR